MDTTTEEYPGVQPYPEGCDHDTSILREVIKFPRHRPDVGLPTREGPQLFPFRPFGTLENLEWVRHVAATEMSVVWKVKVDEQFYALKFFCFPLLENNERFYLERDTLAEDMYDNDAFTCEVRAYGRLKETGTEHIAIKCHGYVLLTPAQERTFRELSTELSTEIPWDLIRRPEYAGFPIRCTIKDWVPEGTPDFTPKMVPRMKRDIITMHSVGIINRDIKWNNYLGGKLFDFGIAWTIPHFHINRLKRSIAEGLDDAEYRLQEWLELRDVDGDRFDDMIEESNLEGERGWIWERFFPNYKYSNLRQRHEVLADRPIRTPNPLEYPWVWNKPVKKLREKGANSSKRGSAGVKKRKAKGKDHQRKK